MNTDTISPIERRVLVFEPCPICGEIEKLVTDGVYRIDHDLVKHGIVQRLESASPHLEKEIK